MSKKKPATKAPDKSKKSPPKKTAAKSASRKMALTATPVPAVAIQYPNGDTVLLSFPSYGTSAAATITAIDVTQGFVPVAGVTTNVSRHPDPTTGIWLVEIDMPSSASGTYELTITDSNVQTTTVFFII